MGHFIQGGYGEKKVQIKAGVLYTDAQLKKDFKWSPPTINKFFDVMSKPEIKPFEFIFEQVSKDGIKINKKYERDIKQITYKIRKLNHEKRTKVGNYSIPELKEKLIEDLTDEGNLAPRLIMTYIMLVQSEKPITRDEIKKALSDNVLAENEGKAGTYLSNISQYITRPANDHVRQIIGWGGVSDDPKGMIKDNFYIKSPENKQLVTEVLTKLNSK